MKHYDDFGYERSPFDRAAAGTRSSVRRLLVSLCLAFAVFFLHYVAQGDAPVVAAIGAFLIGLPVGIFGWFALGLLRFALRR